MYTLAKEDKHRQPSNASASLSKSREKFRSRHLNPPAAEKEREPAASRVNKRRQSSTASQPEKYDKQRSDVTARAGDISKTDFHKQCKETTPAVKKADIQELKVGMTSWNATGELLSES